MKEQADKIKKLLENYSFKLVKHNPTCSAVESAKERNIELKQCVKSLILNVDDKIIEVLISGDKKIDLHKLKEVLNVKNACLADKDLVEKETGCIVGTVHPFCKVINNIETYLDKEILRNNKIDFSIGVNDESIEMNIKDFLKIIDPVILEVSKEL